MTKKIKLLIVDDSATVRDALEKVLSQDPNIEIIGKAEDPFEAAKIIKSNIPDVMTLDIEMPKMDGLTFLRKVMSQRPIATIIISTLSQKGSETAIKALRYGAVDYYPKDSLRIKEDIESHASELLDKVKMASTVRLKRNIPKSVKPKPENEQLRFSTRNIILIGSSTGGTEAIFKVLSGLPANFPPVVITQHMPPVFTQQFAERLNADVPMTVKEVQSGDVLKQGHVYIAPGDQHIELKSEVSGNVLYTNQNEKVNRHRPSVDVTFFSTVKNFGSCKNIIAVLLTGMGRDGAEGLLQLKNAGAYTIAQDEQSCVVYGMPKAAADLGAAHEIVSLGSVSDVLIARTKVES